jgi:hypothetical protein
MNQNLSTDTSTSSAQGVSAEAISRRAYEIWEREGRPEGADLRHWLQAEQELGVHRSDSDARKQSSGAARTESSAPRSTTPAADTRSLQQPGARPSGSTPKRSSTPPFGEKTPSSNQNAAKRKPSNAPVM